MADNTTEETLVVRIVTETQGALSKLAQYEENVKELKKQISDIAVEAVKAGTESSISYDKAALALKRYIDEYNKLLLLSPDPKKTALPLDEKALSQAVRELRTEQKNIADEQFAGIEQNIALQKSLSAQQMADDKERMASIKAQQAAEKDYYDWVQAQEKAKSQADLASVKSKEANTKQQILAEQELQRVQVAGLKEREADIKQRAAIEEELRRQDEAAERNRRKEQKQTDAEALAGIKAQQKAEKEYYDWVEREEKQKRKSQEQTLKDREADIKQQILLQEELDKPVKNQVTWLDKLGTAFQVVFGLTLIQLLQTAYNWTVKILQNMLELSTVMYRFEVSIRGLQRTGLNTTLAEWDSIIASLKSKFPFFSEKDFRAASAQAALMTREFGFTANQMQRVVEVSAVLAELTGRDLTDSITGLTYAISSGYFEALQRAGININRQIVANEALRRGYGANYNALDQNTRAAITFDLILEQLSSLQQDAGKFAETSAGQWKMLQTQWVNLGNTWSTSLEPALVKMLDLLNRASTGVINFINLWKLFSAYITGTVIGIVAGLAVAINMLWKNITGTGSFTAWQIWEKFNQTIDDTAKAVARAAFATDKLLGDTTIGPAPDAEADKIAEVVQDLNAKIKAETVQAEQDLLKIHIDYQNDLLKLERDYAQKRIDLARKLAQKLQDIERDAAQKTEDVNRDYQNDLADIDRDYNNKLADAQQDYHNKEYEAEQKFQEQMRQLREEYLFDLQDAIRERDAGQILRLMRRYNLDKQQANREYLNDKEARERAYQQELADLARQRQEKRDDRARDYQQQLEEIAIEKQRQIEEAQLWYQRELEDLRIWLAQQRQERLIRYKEQIRDLNITIKARLDSLARGLIDEQSLTAQGAKQVYDILNAYYGPGGYMEGLFNYYLQMRNRALGGGSAPNLGGGGGPGFAEGGSFIANSRMSATFGERGPEWVQAIPLTYAGSNVGQFFGTKGVGGGQIGGGKVSVMIDLSDGLVGKIVDNTMGELAEVMIQARGGRTQ